MLTHFHLPLRAVIAEYLLVKAFRSVVELQEKLEQPGGALPPAHVMLLRRVGLGLYNQIRLIQAPPWHYEVGVPQVPEILPEVSRWP